MLKTWRKYLNRAPLEELARLAAQEPGLVELIEEALCAEDRNEFSKKAA
jgi:hypothetical protein